MVNLSLPAIGSLLVTGVALLILIVSMATDYWSESSVSNAYVKITQHHGLVKYCIEDNCEEWADTDGERDYIKGALAMCSLAFIGNIAAIVVVILLIVDFGSDTVWKILIWVARGLMAGTAVLVFTAVIIFAAKDPDDFDITGADYSLEWSWGLAIFAGILDIIAVVVLFFVKRAA